MNFIMIGLLLREALDRLRVRLNMYLVGGHFLLFWHPIQYQSESSQHRPHTSEQLFSFACDLYSDRCLSGHRADTLLLIKRNHCHRQSFGIFRGHHMLYTSIGIGIGIARGEYYWVLDIWCLSLYHSNPIWETSRRHRVASLGCHISPPWPLRLTLCTISDLIYFLLSTLNEWPASRGWHGQIQSGCRVGLSSENDQDDVWNSLPEDMRDLWTVTEDIFYFRSTSMFSALEVCYENALYKFTFDIDIWHWLGEWPDARPMWQCRALCAGAPWVSRAMWSNTDNSDVFW